MQIFARKGEWITCSGEGHKIARFCRDVAVGDVPLPEDLGDWKIARPKLGDPFPLLCNKCSAPWARQSERSLLGLGFEVHLKKDGWK